MRSSDRDGHLASLFVGRCDESSFVHEGLSLRPTNITRIGGRPPPADAVSGSQSWQRLVRSGLQRLLLRVQRLIDLLCPPATQAGTVATFGRTTSSQSWRLPPTGLRLTTTDHDNGPQTNGRNARRPDASRGPQARRPHDRPRRLDRRHRRATSRGRPARGERAYIRLQGNGKLFVSKSIFDTIFFPKDHQRDGQPRYRWDFSPMVPSSATWSPNSRKWHWISG